MLSIQIISTGVFLDLKPKEKISFTAQNPFFFSDVRGSFSYSFKLPYTAKNTAELGNIGVLDSTAAHQNQYQIGIYIDSVLWFVGLMRLKAARYRTEYEAEIDVDFGDFRGLIGEKSLREVITQTFTTSVISSTYKYFYKNVEYTTPAGANPDTISYAVFLGAVQIAGAFAKAGGTILGEGNKTAFEELVTEINVYSAANGNIFTAYLSEWYPAGEGIGEKIIELFILPQSNAYAGVLTISTFNTDDGTVVEGFLERTAEYPNINGTFTDFVFPEIFYEDFYQGGNINFLKILNQYDVPNTEHFRNGTLDTVFNKYAHSPQLYLHKIIAYLCTAAGYTAVGDFITNTDLQKLIIHNTRTTDRGLKGSDTAVSPFLDENDNYLDAINVHNPKITYANHLPDISVNQFLEQLQNVFCLYYRFNIKDKTMSVKFRKDVLQDFQTNAVSFEDKMVITVENIEEKRNIQLQYANDVDANKFFISQKVGSFQKTDIINVDCGTLQYSTSYPAISDDDGNSEMFDLGIDNDFPFRLLFWRGFINSKPTATANETDTFPYSLRWDGAKGLYESWWKDYGAFLLANKQADATCWLDLDTAKKVMERLDEVVIKYGNIYYLIREMNFTVEDSSNPFSKGATCDLVKVSF